MNEKNTGIMQNKEEAVKEISLKEQLKEVEDKLLKIFLEYDEFSRSVQAEKMRSIKGTTANVYVALLPIFDDLDRAKDTIDDIKDLDSLKEELKLISDKLTKSLKSNGLEQMDVKHQDFNTYEHVPISFTSVEKELKGKVLDVLEKGYTFKSKIIKYPKVVVGV